MGIANITQKVAKATAVTDRVTELEYLIEVLGTSNNELLAENQLLREKLLHFKFTQKKYNLIFHRICQMKGTVNEEINNLLDNMFSNEEVHTEIRCNQITIDMAYRLGNAKPNYNSLMMVVLCKLSDKDFILKN